MNKKLTCANRLLQELDSLVLAGVTVALLVVEPTQLLKNLGVVRIPVENAAVSSLSRLKVLLLLVDVTNLEPNILLSQGTRWLVDNELETLQTLLELLLLLVYDTEAEINLVGLFEFGSHAHDLGESLLRMVQRTVAIIQYSDPIPQLRFLWVAQVIQGLLVGCVGLLQVIHHQMAVTQAAPCLSIGGIQLENVLKVFNRFGE